MPPITGSSPSNTTDQKQFLSELTTIQKSIFDQASNYTKLVLGLGYAGFFAAWAGTKSNLRPVELVASALLISLSLFAYIVFEIVQARFNSNAVIDLATTLNSPGLNITAIEQFRKRSASAFIHYAKLWRLTFYFCAGTGVLAALILIEAFFHSLWRMALAK